MPELGPDVHFSYASHKAVEEYKEAKAVCIDDVYSLFIVLHVVKRHYILLVDV